MVLSELHQIVFRPGNQAVSVPGGTTMLEAALQAGVTVDALCGGKGICKKCQVKAPGYPGPPKKAEQEAFGPDQIAEGWRLACLCKVYQDLEIEVVPVPDYAAKSFKSLDRPPIPLAPNVRRWNLHLPEPSLEDQRSDWARLRAAIPGGEELQLHPEVLLKLSDTLRRAHWQVSVTAIGNVIVEVERAHLRPPMGLAVDIGTTSVVAMLVNLSTGTAVEIGAHSNSQGAHGAEVMARMDFAITPNGTRTMQQEVVGDINRILRECCERSGVDPRDIYEMTVVANTTMVHLFLGLCPHQIGVSPFVGVINDAYTVEAARLGLEMHPRSQVYVLPSIAGFVGADTVGVILATGMHKTDRCQLAIDIGTNGEIVVVHQGRLFSCSAPAGPAFEGGQIKHGMRATPGAIDTFRATPAGVEYTTIAGAPARGICGSALIDICAQLYKVGVINQGGRILTAEEMEEAGETAALALGGRVIDSEEVREFLLVPAAESATGRPITLTQQDVRQFQLAKGSILSGAQILMQDMGITAADLDEVLLAGTFGSHIHIESARLTALIPDVPPEKVRYVGNAAHEGARMALLNTACRREAEEFAHRVHHAELSARQDFADAFVAALGFGEREPTEELLP